MSILQAAETVLDEAGEPLHYNEITRRILEQNLWISHGETPEATVNAHLAVDIKRHGASSHFQRTDKGVFALRSWGLPEYSKNDGHAQVAIVSTPAGTVGVKPSSTASAQKTLSFTDAAEYVLEHFGQKKPMHYRDITRKAIEAGLLNTQGQTPEGTMYAQILTEIARQARRGEPPRFVKLGKGRVSLARWHEQPPELIVLIEQHNHEVRQQLHTRLLSMPPTAFEELMGELLAALGFEEVTVTKPSGDGGIDVRGTLVIGEVISLRMAVQVKRWKNNIQLPTVQQVRGSLGIHEQGLIITTSDFSPGARQEAARSNAAPVALMNGEQLVALLVEHNIGVHRTAYDLIELGEEHDE